MVGRRPTAKTGIVDLPVIDDFFQKGRLGSPREFTQFISVECRDESLLSKVSKSSYQLIRGYSRHQLLQVTYDTTGGSGNVGSISMCLVPARSSMLHSSCNADAGHGLFAQSFPTVGLEGVAHS